MFRNHTIMQLLVASATLLPLATTIAAAAGPYGASGPGTASSSGGPLAIGGVAGLVMDNNHNVALTLSPGPYQTINPATLGAFVVHGINHGYGGDGLVSDCAITPDRSTAFVAGSTANVQVINLTSNPPAIVSSIPVSNATTGLSLTPNGKYLLVTNGEDSNAIDVIDVANWTDQGTFTPTSGAALSTGVCDNGVDVVSMDYSAGVVNLLKISALGVLSNFQSQTSPVITYNSAHAYCAPGSHAAITMDIFPGVGGIASFTVPGLNPVSTISTKGQSAAFSPSGTVLYVRFENDGGTGGVTAYDFNPDTGVIGSQIWTKTLDVDTRGIDYDINQIAVSPDGKSVFVPGFNGLNVLNAATGALTVVTNPSLTYGTGICLAPTSTTSSTPPPNPCGYHSCQ